MAPNIIEFEKTLQERLQEYKDMFSVNASLDEGYPESCKERVLGSQVKEFWRNYLSVTLIPRGWRAIWKVPVEKCHLMSLEYPCEILVEVLSTSLEDFSTEVNVISIDDEPLPQTKRSAALIELFPVDFGSEIVDAWMLAYDLDKFRFFFQQLWFPWDETDDSDSWPDTQLEKRLNLLYDMVTGEMRVDDAERIRYLISKSRYIQEEIEKVEVAIEECEDDVDSGSVKRSDHESDYSEEIGVLSSQLEKMDIPDSTGEKKLSESEETLMVHMFELQKEMKSIQDEVELLSSPSIRTALANEQLRRYKQLMPVKEVSTFSKHLVAVLGKGSMFELKSFLDLIESRYGKEGKYDIEIHTLFQLAKDLVPCKETIFVLCAGCHLLKSSEEFLSPGTIVEEAVLLVDRGSLSIKKCSFVHASNEHSPRIEQFSLPSTNLLKGYERFGNNSKTYEISPGSKFSMPHLPITAAFAVPPQRGIAVGAGGILTAHDCYFEGLHLGIIAYSKAKVYLSNCKFSNCHVAIRVSKGAELVVESCNFESSKAVSLHVLVGFPHEQEKQVKEVMNGLERLVGSCSLLERVPGIHLTDCIFMSDEGKDDVLLSAFNEKHNTLGS